MFILAVAALATLGVLARPFDWPEASWAGAGAVALVLLRLLTPGEALRGVARGADVYLFLTGMMLLAELGREERLFDWLAALAARRARGSATRLFALVYLAGIAVTVFLSNDATAVVLTPGVAAAARAAKTKEPLPYLFSCAFIANAASFVLPISNPANLVIYGAHLPPLWQWLPRFALPSLVSIGATFLLLRFSQRAALRQPLASEVPLPELRRPARIAAAGIGLTAVVLLTASAFELQLGLPTALAGALTATAVLISRRAAPWKLLRSISWSVLPLVAGLFVLVEGLHASRLVDGLGRLIHDLAVRSETGAAWTAGLALGFGSNLVNNLPAGLVAGSALQSAQVPEPVIRAAVIGVDLGPNLSVTGSLATLLWLTALRREGHRVSAFAFLKLGALVMTPALLLSLGAALLFHR